MKYKVVKTGDYSYKVYTRPWWWPFWTKDTHYVRYDTPKKVEQRGGFFGDIITKETVYGTYSSSFTSADSAKERIVQLKADTLSKKNRKTHPKREIVHTE